MQKLMTFFLLLFKNEEHSFKTLSDIDVVIEHAILKNNILIRNIVDQVDMQIKSLKASIWALYEILPFKPLDNSGITVFNTSQKRLLRYLRDPQVKRISKTPFGIDLRATHIHADLTSKTAIHGAFIFFRFGHKNDEKSKEQARALINFARFAHRHCFHIYFNIDNIAVIGGDNYSQLPVLLKDWIDEYKKSSFHKTLMNEAEPDLKRRLTNVFNDYVIDIYTQNTLIDTQQRKSEHFEMIDRKCIAPPVSLIAKKLVKNYEQYGFDANIVGLNVTKDKTQFYSKKHAGTFTTKNFDHKYFLTVWNIISDLDLLSLNIEHFSPLQKMIKKIEDDHSSIIIERISIANAQTLLPKPEMFNSLHIALLEDLILRGIILLTRNFIGKSATKTKKELEKWVEHFMYVYRGKKGSDEELYNFEPALKDYKAECEVTGQRAKVQLEILPNHSIKDNNIKIEQASSVIGYHKGTGGRQLSNIIV